jgi:hypothetical protein
MFESHFGKVIFSVSESHFNTLRRSRVFMTSWSARMATILPAKVWRLPNNKVHYKFIYSIIIF